MNGTAAFCPFSPLVATGAIQLALVRDPSAVRFARRLVREWYPHWGLPEQIIDAGELVCSELVTNAITKANSQTVYFRIRWHG
jgi:anti-sigma regulatory factor (Ser/Thr protein kinase)